MTTPSSLSGDEPPVPTSIDFVFEMGMKKLEDQIEAFRALDAKTGVIMGFVIVSISEILGFLLLAAAEGLKPSWYFSVPVVIVFLLALAFVVVATVLGFFSLRARRVALGLRFSELISEAQKSEHVLKTMFLDDLQQSIAGNVNLLAKKQCYATISTICAVAGLLCYAWDVILLLFAFMARR